MQRLGDGIWVHEDAMHLGGTQLRLRMTVVLLAGGNLWVHSPTTLTEDLRREIDELGTVGIIVGPNNGHNMWLLDWHAAYPEAELFVSAGIPDRIRELQDYTVLDTSQENIWQQDLDTEYMHGARIFDEWVFLHRKTKSLILTDLIQNHSDERPTGWAGFMTRFILEPIGFKGICVAPPLRLGFVIRDKAAFAAFIEKIRTWDFDRIVVTHGDIIESDAKQVFSDLTQRFLS
jgi:hypothetical protein